MTGPEHFRRAEELAAEAHKLARVTTLIARLFHVRYTLRGTSYLLHRLGYTPRSPSTGPPSATRRLSPCGRPRPGSSFEASGGDRSVDLLRGRGWAEPAPAQGEDLGTPRPYPHDRGIGERDKVGEATPRARQGPAPG